MDTKTLQTIREKLEVERQTLTDQLRQNSVPTPDEPDQRTAKFPNYGDSEEENASEVADYSANLPVEKQLEASLQAMNEAIGRIEAGTYGHCDVCGREIDGQRLLAMPTARTCREHAAA